MVNLVNVRKWADALESGRYAQGTGMLCALGPTGMLFGPKARYCCLGVACELAVADGLSIVVTKFQGERSYDGMFAFLPTAVQIWLGIAAEPDPVLDFGSIRSAASAANDSGQNFSTIAAAIRRTWLEPAQ